MKKPVIAGVAALAAIAGGTGAYALTAADPEPVAPAAPTSTATAEPTASATPQPTSAASAEPVAYPAADEAAFLALVHRDWQGAEVPSDDEALAAGYEVCEAYETEVAVDDQRFPQWSGLDNFAIHFAAGAALCPADG